MDLHSSDAVLDGALRDPAIAWEWLTALETWDLHAERSKRLHEAQSTMNGMHIGCEAAKLISDQHCAKHPQALIFPLVQTCSGTS